MKSLLLAAAVCDKQGCEPKTESVFFRSVFVGFSRPKTTFFLVGFPVPPKTETEKRTRFFSVGFVLQPTAAKKRKTDGAIFIFGLFSVYLRFTTLVAT